MPFPFSVAVQVAAVVESDASDAEAICEAVSRPTMRYVAIKSCEQQAALTVHRTRDLFVKQRTQLVNMIRGLLA